MHGYFRTLCINVFPERTRMPQDRRFVPPPCLDTSRFHHRAPTRKRSPRPVVPITAVCLGEGPQLTVPSLPPITRGLVPRGRMRITRDRSSGRLQDRRCGHRALSSRPCDLWSLRLHASTAVVVPVAGTLAPAAPPMKKGLRGNFGRARTRSRGLARRSCSGTCGRAGTCLYSKYRP